MGKISYNRNQYLISKVIVTFYSAFRKTHGKDCDEKDYWLDQGLLFSLDDSFEEEVLILLV